MSEDLWRQYVDALSGSAALESMQAEQRQTLEVSLNETREDVEAQHREAVTRVEKLASEIDTESKRIRVLLASAGVPVLVGGAPEDSDTSTVDAEGPDELLDRLRGLAHEIGRQSATLEGILRAERRAGTRAEEEVARRVALAERARERQAAMDQARREATRSRQSATEQPPLESTTPVPDEPAPHPATQPAVSGGWRTSPVIWGILVAIAMAVVLALVLL